MMGFFGLIALTQIGIAALGLNGFRLSNEDLNEVYQARLVPVSELARINDLMRESVEQTTIAVIGRQSPKNIQKYIDSVEANLAEIDRLVQGYEKRVAYDEDRKLLNEWSAKRATLVGKGIRPALVALKAQAFDDAEDTVLGVAMKQFEETQRLFNAILAGELNKAGQTENAANRRYEFTRNVAIAAVLLAVGLCAGMAGYVRRSITRPLATVTEAMKSLASGDTNVDVPHAERADEIGETAKAAQRFKDSLIRIDAMKAAQHEAEARAAAQRKADMHTLADGFEKAVGNIVDSVSSSATELEAAAGTLTHTAETTQQLAGVVASASEEASTNVQTVAAATDELSASVGEISRQVHESHKIAGEAVKQAEKTDARINQLSQAASRIGDVVKLITAIAEQTNLLALNATIEAARAGEAGRGFAVVASEVKSLANQTAKATEEIGSQIAGMQAATQDSVAAIKEIGATIGHISEIASTIAAAVEEQGAATKEISRNVQEAAKGTTEVAANIADVNRGAGETGSASTQVLSSAQALAGEGNRLKLEVDKFVAGVRAA
jgi:methyl-accepting chemotaxis protein